MAPMSIFTASRVRPYILWGQTGHVATRNGPDITLSMSDMAMKIQSLER